MLAEHPTEKGESMLELIMQVSRSAQDRLSGTVRLREGSELHHFSGTLELMRVFEIP